MGSTVSYMRRSGACTCCRIGAHLSGKYLSISYIRTMIEISETLQIADEEVTWTAVRAQGAGGQNVNKVSSAIHLRFDIPGSSLPQWIKQRLLQSGDQRITKEGVLVIKAQVFRSQERNKQAAIERLREIVRAAAAIPTVRRTTRPTHAARERRLSEKKTLGERKRVRRIIRDIEH